MASTALALDFPLGQPIMPAVLARRRRLLPAGATPLVAAGDQARADQPIGELTTAGGPRTVFIAGLGGRVVESQAGRGGAAIIIEGMATLIHGVVGLGGQAAGQLALVPRGEALALAPIVRGSVIIFPHQVPLMLLQRAVSVGAVGIIAASASARELEAFARADLTALLDGHTSYGAPSPLTIVLTEGLGAASMSTAAYYLLSQRLHDTVLLDGTTDLRHNVRPEVALSAPPGSAPQPTPADFTIGPGAVVVVSAGPRRGARGTVIYTFAAHQPNAAGLRVPSVRVRLEDGAVETLPLHALDRIG
jgi:hypothetical protein